MDHMEGEGKGDGHKHRRKPRIPEPVPIACHGNSTSDEVRGHWTLIVALSPWSNGWMDSWLYKETEFWPSPVLKSILIPRLVISRLGHLIVFPCSCQKLVLLLANDLLQLLVLYFATSVRSAQ